MTVFTDITCGYCVRLHQEMKEYNKRGITVRYLAFPRRVQVDKLLIIWRKSGVHQTLHRRCTMQVTREPAEVAQGKNLAQCKQTITDHYQLGRQLGISGTPAIFFRAIWWVVTCLHHNEQRLQQQLPYRLGDSGLRIMTEIQP